MLVETISGPVAKFGPGRRNNSASFLVCLEKGVKGDLSQGQDHTDTFQQLELAEEVRATLLKLHSGGLVGRRRTGETGPGEFSPGTEAAIGSTRLSMRSAFPIRPARWRATTDYGL